MFKRAFMRVRRSSSRRKLGALSMGVVAAISAVGLVQRDAPGAAISTVVTKVSNGEVAPALAAVASAITAGRSSRAELARLQHPSVNSWIKRFTTDQRGSYATYLKRMTRYEDMISGKLAKRGMPQDLIYLAMIESGFNATARSPVKASGLWQFMGPTAKQYGLTVTRRLDERNNPARSTDAALKYLGKLHDRFGSWYLAAAAYNTGEGRVGRVLKQVTGKTRGTDADFYRIASRLPKETRDYVPKLIAAARIGNDPASYGFK
jgi:membrane-bound lytic murein transglycosylase D